MNISTYTNPFERTPDHVKQFPTGKSLLWYLEQMGLSPDHYILILNGGVIPHCELNTFIPKEGDDIIARPFVQGSSGGKTALNILVMAAVVIGSVLVPGLGLPLWGAALAVGGIAAAGAAISTFAIGRPHSSTAETPTYGWNGAATTAQQGLPVPINGGAYFNYGNVIASYVESVSDQQFLHMLVCMGIGPARRLNTVRINDQPIENYTNATWEARLGKNEQPVCTDFEALHNVSTIDQRVLAGPGSSPIVINGTQNDTEAVDFTFLFPRGLWAGPNGDGSYDSWAVMLQIEYQKVGDPGWTTYVVPGVLNPVDSVPYWLAVVKDYRYANGQEVVIDQSLDPNAHYEGQTFSQDVSVVPVDTNSVVQAARTITVTGTWKKNPANGSVGPTYATGSTFSTPGSWSTVACSFESNEGQTPKRFTFRLAMPSPGQYNFRVTKLGSNQHAGQSARLYSDDGKLFETYTRRGEETWVYSMDEISYQEYTYPNQILLALKVQATNQLSGGGIKVSALVEMDNQDTQGYVHAVRWDQPSSYYRLDDLGATANDLVGSNPGTYGSGVIQQVTSLIANSPDTGVQATAPGDPIFTAELPTASAFAIEMLFKPDSLGSDFWLVEAFGVIIGYRSGTGTLVANMGGFDLLGTHSIEVGKTYHVAAVMGTDGVATLMLNGQVEAQRTLASTCTGTASFGRGLVGTLDEVAVYGTYAPQLCRIRKHYLDSLSDHNALEAYPANLPAILVVHLITDTLNGGGMSSALLDVPFFQRWADRSLEHVPDGAGGVITRHSWDGILDEVATLWDAINRIAHVGGATMMRTGFTFTGILDAPGLPKRLINVGQVIKGTFKETWSNVDDRANTIDVSFYDELNFFKKTTVTVQMASVVNGGVKQIKAPAVELRGCTSIARAWHYGNYILKSTQMLDRTATFDQTIESLAAWPGEVIYLQHDLPRWGNGGKLEPGCTTTELYLDQDLDDWDTDQVYTMLVQLKLVPLAVGATIQRIVNNIVYFTTTVITDTEHASRFVAGVDDYTIVDCGTNWVKLDRTMGLAVGNVGAVYAQNYVSSRDVDAYDPTTRKVTLSSALPVAPSEFDSWTFGSVGKGAPVPFHVGKIGRKKDLSATLECIVYMDAVYTDDVPQIDPSPIVNDNDATVEQLTGHEILSPTGTEPLFSVSWKWGPSTVGSLVYVSRNGGPEVLFEDVHQGTSIDIPAFTNDSILVRVVGYDAQGKSAPYRTSPTVSTTLVGYNANPDNVTGFGVAAWDLVGHSMELAWNANTQLDVTGYVISYFSYITFNPSQADCDANVIATVSGRTTTTQLLNGGAYRGIGTYAIRALNSGGFFSLTPSLIRAYSLDDVQTGVQNKTRTPSNGQMVTVPPQPWITVAEPTLISGPNGPYMPADITFIPFTMNTGKELISVLTGNFTISGLVQGEAYYFYYEDPSYLGGAVTMHATQDPAVIIDPAAQGGRFVMNGGKPVTMPVYVGGASSALVVVRPTAYDTSSGVLARSPELAYDKNLLSYAETTVDPAGAGSQTLTYRDFEALPSGFSPSAMELLVDTALESIGTGGAPYLEYSTDSGATWNPLTPGGGATATNVIPASAWASNISFNGTQYEFVGTQLRTKGGVSNGTHTDWVYAHGFGFAIPSGAAITGIRVDLEWVGQNSGTGIIEQVALFLSGSIFGSVKTPGTPNLNTIGDAVYGGLGDTWSSGVSTAQVNDPGFGFGIQVLAQGVGSTNRSFFDRFTITVFYDTLPPNEYGVALSPTQNVATVQVRLTPSYTDISDYTMVKIYDVRIEAKL